MSELESVRIQFSPILKEIGKCQNWKVSESESVINPVFAHFGRNWKVSELESVRIRNCRNWKVPEFADSLYKGHMMLG